MPIARAAPGPIVRAGGGSGLLMTCGPLSSGGSATGGLQDRGRPRTRTWGAVQHRPHPPWRVHAAALAAAELATQPQGRRNMGQMEKWGEMVGGVGENG